MSSPENEPGRTIEITSPEQNPPIIDLVTEGLPLRKAKFKPVEIFNAAKNFRPLEWWHHLEERARPGAFATVATLDLAAGFVVLPTLETTVAAAINAAMNTDPALTIPAVAGSIVGLTALSIRQEIRALRQERISATTVATGTFTITGDAALSSVINHAGNYFFDTLILNPVTTVAILTHNTQLAAESFATTPFATASWYMAVNTLIASGQVEKLVNPINKVKEATLGRVTRKIKRNSSHDTDLKDK